MKVFARSLLRRSATQTSCQVLLILGLYLEVRNKGRFPVNILTREIYPLWLPSGSLN
jgi:hypothetical protein